MAELYTQDKSGKSQQGDRITSKKTSKTRQQMKHHTKTGVEKQTFWVQWLLYRQEYSMVYKKQKEKQEIQKS